MNDLAERKRLLILESELHRSIILVEAEGIKSRLQFITQLRQQVSPRNPWFVGGSALAGLLAVRHWRKTIRWLPQAFAVWKLWRKRDSR